LKTAHFDAGLHSALQLLDRLNVSPNPATYFTLSSEHPQPHEVGLFFKRTNGVVH